MRIKGDDRLLVVQPLVGIGDMVWHKPWIDQLISDNDVILAVKKASHAPLLFGDALPAENYLFIERNERGQKGRHDGLLGLLDLAKAFRKTGAKRALILHHSRTYHHAARLAGITDIAGFGFGKGRSSAKMLSKEDRPLHSLQKMAKFWKINDWPESENGWRIPIRDKAKLAAQNWLSHNNLVDKRFIVLGIGAMHKERLWPADRFAGLIKLMREKRSDLVPVIMGGPAEKEIADTIQAQLGKEPAITLFEPLDDGIAALSMASGYVGNDTSLLNIAAVLGVPSLGLFSQSAPLTYVENLHHLDIIAEKDYGRSGIILSYQVDDVFDALQKLHPAA